MLIVSRLQISKAFKSSLFDQHTQISLLCNRLGLLQVSSSRNLTTDATKDTSKVEEIEKLRRKAFEVQLQTSTRSRCPWTKEESDKLVELVKTHGPKWTFISSMFVNRPPTTVMNRYKLIEAARERGPWSKDELEKLKELGRGRSFEEIDNWDEIQRGLPHRPYFLIRQKYKNTIDPTHKHGRWTKDETEKLIELVSHYGPNDMDMIAKFLGTRNSRQCFEKWHWQINETRKGRYTPQEDALILEAVAKFGENFAVVQKVTKIPRTPRHISQHYHNILHPNIDRSPWSPEEEKQVYLACKKNDRNMLKTKKELKSRRSTRDMWNHYFKLDRMYKPDSEN